MSVPFFFLFHLHRAMAKSDFSYVETRFFPDFAVAFPFGEMMFLEFSPPRHATLRLAH